MIRPSKAVSLWLAGVLLSGAALAQPKKRGVDDAEQKELHDYVLTMDKINKMAAVTKAFQDYGKRHPEVNSDKNSDSKSLDEMVQKIQKLPEAQAILAKNGISARDYAVGFFSLMQASIAVGAKKPGAYKDYPPEMLKLVSTANLAFVEQHFDEITKLTKMSDDDQ